MKLEDYLSDNQRVLLRALRKEQRKKYFIMSIIAVYIGVFLLADLILVMLTITSGSYAEALCWFGALLLTIVSAAGFGFWLLETYYVSQSERTKHAEHRLRDNL